MSLATVRAASIRLAQVSAIAISLAGATAFGGASLPVLFSWNTELAETLPVTSTFTRASTSEVLTTTDGTTFWYQEAKSGELRLDGMRRVEQRLIGSHDFANAAWTASNITVNGGTELVASGATPNISQAIASLPIGEYIFAIKVSLTSGSIGADGDVSIDFAGTSLDIGSEITGSPQVIQVRHTEATGGSLTATLNIASGLTLEVAFGHVEYVGGRTTDVFGAEVDDSVEYLNVGVNGVLYLNTDQANTAAGNGVVTEAAGTTITGGGYLPEPAATNLIEDSNEYDATSWTNNNLDLTDNGVNSLGLRQYTFDDQTSTGTHRIFENIGSQSGDHTFSVIAKAGTGQFLAIGSTNGGSAHGCFDLINGIITETGGSSSAVARITALGDDWYKCEVSTNTGAETYFPIVAIANTGTPGGSSQSYTGTNQTILVCHVQEEATAFSTSPIITSGSTVTRVADTLTTGVNANAATSFLVDATAPAVAGSTAPSLAAVDGSSDDRVAFINDTSIISEADVQATITNDIRGERHKIAASWEQVSGGLIVVDDESNSATGTPTAAPWDGADMTIGYGGSTQYWRGRIHNFVQYGASQTQAQLEALVA